MFSLQLYKSSMSQCFIRKVSLETLSLHMDQLYLPVEGTER